MVVAGSRTHLPRLNQDGSRVFSRLRDYAGRGVLTTATYEARALGVHSGMPAMKAARLAPDALLLPVNFELYRRFSRLFKDAVRSVSPIVEDIGIDEVYADVTAFVEDSEEIASRLKTAVLAATGLTCSVGIGPNKLLAKLCSDMQKPNGVTAITMDDVPSRVWSLPASRINGIGPKASQKLASFGITTIGDIATQTEAWLAENFGIRYGAWLHRVSRGLDDRPIVTHSEPVSMSRETTFDRNLHAKRDREELSTTLTRLCEQVSADLQRKGYIARTIGIKLRFEDFKTVTRDVTIPNPTSEAAAVRRATGKCLQRVELSRTIRLLGVRASALQHAGTIRFQASEQMTLDLDGF